MYQFINYNLFIYIPFNYEMRCILIKILSFLISAVALLEILQRIHLAATYFQSAMIVFSGQIEPRVIVAQRFKYILFICYYHYLVYLLIIYYVYYIIYR